MYSHNDTVIAGWLRLYNADEVVRQQTTNFDEQPPLKRRVSSFKRHLTFVNGCGENGATLAAALATLPRRKSIASKIDTFLLFDNNNYQQQNNKKCQLTFCVLDEKRQQLCCWPQQKLSEQQQQQYGLDNFIDEIAHYDLYRQYCRKPSRNGVEFAKFATIERSKNIRGKMNWLAPQKNVSEQYEDNHYHCRRQSYYQCQCCCCLKHFNAHFRWTFSPHIQTFLPATSYRANSSHFSTDWQEHFDENGVDRLYNDRRHGSIAEEESVVAAASNGGTIDRHAQRNAPPPYQRSLGAFPTSHYDDDAHGRDCNNNTNDGSDAAAVVVLTENYDYYGGALSKVARRANQARTANAAAAVDNLMTTSAPSTTYYNYDKIISTGNPTPSATSSATTAPQKLASFLSRPFRLKRAKSVSKLLENGSSGRAQRWRHSATVDDNDHAEAGFVAAPHTIIPNFKCSAENLANYYANHQQKATSGRAGAWPLSVYSERNINDDDDDEAAMRRHLCVADGGRVVRQIRAAHSDESLMRGGGSGRFGNDPERMAEGGARLPDIRQIHPQGCGSIHDLAELCGGTMRGGELQVLHASVIDVPHCFKLEKKVFACGTPQARARWVEGIRRAMNPRRDADRRVEHSLSVWILEAKGVAVKRRYYCELCLDGCLYARTSAKPRQDICFWGESYEFSCIPPVNDICINLFREADPKKKKDRSTLIGFVRIAIGQIAQRYPVEKWYTVSTSADGRQADGVSAGSSSAKSNGNGGDAPAIRVKARFQTVDILPRHCYDRLLVFVRDNYLPLCLVLEPVLGVKAKEDLAISLVRVLHRERLAKQFLCDLIMAEINALDNDHLMFRGNSLATKAMEAYMKLVAADYLQATLGEFVRGVLDSPENCEVDPLKLGNGSPSAAELQRNRRTLTALVERAWRRILDAAPALPTQLREVFRELRTRIERTGRSGSGDVANTLISSSIFLRFLCPAILSPSLFNLVHEYPSGMAARNLTLIAKTLQTLANFTRFGGKESYMEFMNAFVECEFRRMHDFLVRISQPPVAADGDTQAADGVMVFCSGHPTNGTAIAPCRLATDADVDAEIDFGKEAALLYAYLQESWTAQIQEKAKLENKRLAELWAILLEVAMKRTESADLASGSTVAAANASSASASSNNRSSSHHHPSTSSSNGSRHSSSQGGNNGGGGARIHPDYDNPPQYDADDDFNDLGSNCGGDDGNGRSGNGTTTSGNPPSDYENNVISHHIAASNQRPSANTGCFLQASSSSAANADHRYYCQPHVVADRLDTADDYVLSEALPYSNNGNGPPHVASSSCYYYSSNERSPVATNPSVRHNEFYVAEQHNPLVTAVKSSSGSGSLVNGQFLNLSLSSGGCRRSSSPKQSDDQFSNLNSVVPTQKSNGFFVQQAGRVGIHHRLPPNGQHSQQRQPRIPSGGKAEDYCYPSDVVPVAEGSYYDCTPKASCSTASSSVAPPSHYRSGSSSSTRREYYHIYDDTPSLPSSFCYDGHHRPSPLQRSASSGRKTNRQSPPLSPSYHIADQAPNFYDEVPSLSTAYNRFMPPSVANVKPAAGRTNTMGRRSAADEAEDAEEDEELKMALQNAHSFATAHSIPSVIPPPPAPRQQLQQRPKMTAPAAVSCCNSLPPPLSATVTPMSSSSSSAGYHSGGPSTAAHSINYNSYSFPSDHHNRHQLIPTRLPESNEQCTNGFCHQTDDDAAAATIAAADGTASSQGYASAAPTIDECGCGSSSASASSAASYHRLSSAPPSAHGTLSSSASSSSGVPPRPTQASAVITASPIPARAVLVGASVGTFYFDGIPDDDASAIPSALNGCDALPKNGVNLSTVIGGSYCAAAKKCSAASTKSASDAEDIIDRQKREIEKLLRENDQLKRELADRDGSGTSMSVSNGSASIAAPSVAGRRLADSSSLGHFERK